MRPLFACLALALVGCASTPAEEPETTGGEPAAPQEAPAEPTETPQEAISVPAELERILELEDSRTGSEEDWKQLLASKAPELRARAARALGRLREPRLAQVAVVALDGEPEEAVRSELLFALGQMARREDRQVLERWLTTGQPTERARAAEALGKLGDPAACASLLEQLGDADPTVRGAATLALVRLRGRRVKPARPLDAGENKAWLAALSKLCADEDAGVRWRAVYALANVPIAGSLASLRDALGSEDATVRLFAARGLGRLKGDDLIRGHLLRAHLEKEQDPHAAASTARSLASLGSLPDIGGVPVLLAAAKRKARPSDHHVRRAALKALGDLAASGSVSDEERKELLTLFRIASRDPASLSVRAEGLLQFARLDPQGADTALQVAAKSPDGPLRASAASAAAAIGRVSLLSSLAEDPDPRVASAALSGMGRVEGQAAATRAAALKALAVPDLSVRGTALALLQTTGKPDDVPKVAPLLQLAGSDNVELRVEAASTLGFIGAMPGGKERVLPALREALNDPAHAVRSKAATTIEALTGTAPEVAAPAEPLRSTVATLVFGEATARPTIVLETNKGELHLELFPREAPRHVWSLLDRAIQGKHDGLIFHRVVTGFVVQGLDPRGDGWGSDGVLIRDEINPRPYLRGSLGMPNSGPDTAGCQVFVTHVPTPHLDGRYTVFGRVVEGFDVLDALDVGDRCLGVEVVD